MTCHGSYNSLKIIDKANSKFDLKIEEALHINWGKPNINAQQNYSNFTFTIASLSPLFLYVFAFCLSLSSIVFIISDTNFRHLLLSQLHFVITSSDCNTPSITYFPFFYFFYI